MMEMMEEEILLASRLRMPHDPRMRESLYLAAAETIESLVIESNRLRIENVILRNNRDALQAKRKPLSSELLAELAQQANKTINPCYEFARAIEAAHGIVGEE